MMTMKNWGIKPGLVVFLIHLCCHGALAQSADYFLERVAIHARAFESSIEENEQVPVAQEHLGEFGGESETGKESPAVSVEPELSWSLRLVQEDLSALQADLEDWKSKVPSPDKNVYAGLRTGLERHSRRLKVSTSPLTLSTRQLTTQKLLLLELDEAARGIDNEWRLANQRQELQRSERRRRSNISIGFGGWNNWGPWGQGAWGVDPFFHPGLHPGFFRRGFRSRCW